MIYKLFTLIAILVLSWLSYSSYSNDKSKSFDFDIVELENNISKLKSDLELMSKEYEALNNDYQALKSSSPAKIQSELQIVKNKLSELDSVFSDQSNILKKIDPSGILADTEAWIGESYENAINREQNEWSRVSSAEIIERYNRMDEEVYESITDVYLNADNGRMKAYSLGVIKEYVAEDMKEPLLKDLRELTKDGDFKNGWHLYNLTEALGNFASDPEVAKEILFIAENHPDNNIARVAAEQLGMEIETY